MFEMRTNSCSTSINSLFVTYLYYTNLYSTIEQFVKFLRVDYATTKRSLLYNILCNRLHL